MSHSLTARELAQGLQQHPDWVVLDVRQAWEYDQGHIPNARLIPLDELTSHLDELLPLRDHKIIVYCKAGVRSSVACQILAGHNFTAVSNLVDGWLGWSAL